MSDPETEPMTPLGLPMQPTGSGVADLEIAREQEALAAQADAATPPDPDALVPTEDGPDADASEAQPS